MGFWGTGLFKTVGQEKLSQDFGSECRLLALSWLLAHSALSWDFWSQVCLKLWASGLAPCTDRSTHRTSRCRVHQGLRPLKVRSSLPYARSHTGTCASLGSSLWDYDSVQHGTCTQDNYLETESSTPQTQKERGAARRRLL